MKKIVFLSIFLFLVLFLAHSQIKLESTGRFQVGSVPDIVNNDPDNVVSMQLFGKESSMGAGSKLSFGDFGRQVGFGWNVFIGEFGTTDTDQLWLHGKKGVIITYSNGTNDPGTVIGYYDASWKNAFKFNCDIYTNGLKLVSDIRLKENVEKINGSLDLLDRLDGVSYNLVSPVHSANGQLISGPMSDKEQQDIAFFKNREKELEKNKERQFGFIAQEVKEIFPELVSEGKDGMLSVDYIGLIPVIVEGMKEQNQIIEEQNQKIEKLEESLAEINGRLQSGQTGISSLDSNNSKDAFLYQNVPNPFSDQTEIRYFVSGSIREAYICIYNMLGVLQKKILVNKQDPVFINASELPAGTYIYTLVADGRAADSKRMILTN